MMDLRKIKKLIELLEQSQLSEIEISEGRDSIRLVRTAVGTESRLLPTVAASSIVEKIHPGDGQITDHANTVNSPIVGIFYAASTPDEDPYVKIGAQVKQNDTLCLIESMKTYNQIKADRAGTVQEVYKESGDPVEYGEALFLII